jgi:benzylsuccinate CoA-transferase BbsF subunit
MSDKPILQGIRVLDFSWVLAGPYATRTLADFGAEVIKVQPLLTEADDVFSRGYYNTWNRNKLGITLNLSKPAGIDIARKLIKISDVVVENFSPRVMENWGLDYSELVKINSSVIMLSMSAMGHTGLWRDYIGFGPSIQAFSGITNLTTYPGQPPLGMGYSYSDHIAGLYAGLALLSALEYRHQTGEGQFIDLSQTETMTSLLAETFIDCSLKGREPVPRGNRSAQAAPQGIYPCQGEDRWCAITVSTDIEWEGFKHALGSPTWADEPQYSKLDSRLKNAQALDCFISEWTREHLAEDVMAIMQKENVPAGVVQNAEDLFADPQLRFRGFFQELRHPETGNIFTDASPIHLSVSPAEYHRPAPTRGQDNEYVYRQILSLTEDEIDRLKWDNII